MLEASSERVSDAEREQAAGLLKGHLVAGRLTTEEFAERVGQAYGARVRADLSLALTDLPPDGSTACLLYTSPSPRDRTRSRMPSSA